MFWLECGDVRSGQYLFYDLKLSKAPCNIPIPEVYTSGQSVVLDGGDRNRAAAPGETATGKKKRTVTEEERQERLEKAAKAVGVGLGILNSIMK